MIFENKEPDIDLLIKCLIENGCTVKKAKDGEGGIYLKGKKLTDEELIDCVMHPWGDDETFERNFFSIVDDSSDACPYIFPVKGEIMSILITGRGMPKSCVDCFCDLNKCLSKKENITLQGLISRRMGD